MSNMITTEMYHHGIFGQKWGRRRFQNEDGSLTPEGIMRYGRGKKESKPSFNKEKPVSYKDMSDEDLLKSIERMKNEKQYIALAAETKDISSGRRILNDALSKAGKEALTTVATKGLTFLGGAIINKLTGYDVVDLGKKTGADNAIKKVTTPNKVKNMKTVSDEELGKILKRMEDENKYTRYANGDFSNKGGSGISLKDGDIKKLKKLLEEMGD